MDERDLSRSEHGHEIDDKNAPELGNDQPQASYSVTPSSSADQVPVPQRSSDSIPLENIFLGKDGLRAGWRLLLFFAFVIGTLYLERAVFSGLFRHVRLQIWLYLTGESELLLAVLVGTAIMSRIEGRNFGVYGLPARLAFKKSFWIGALWGIVSLSVLLLTMRVLGAFHLYGLAVHGARIVKFAAFYGLFFLVVAFFEEFLFRGYVQFTLTQGIGFWPAAALLSVGFGAIHLGNKGEAWIGAAAVVFIGLFWCLTLRRTGTLWFAVGLHAAWDWGETYLYSVPDSGQVMPGHLLKSSFHGASWITGGSVGPEGSVLVFVVIALMWLVFQKVYPQVKYQP
jgi:CAAX protease family protein